MAGLNVLYLGSSASPTANANAIINHLIAVGHTVTYANSSAYTSAPTGFDLVVQGSSLTGTPAWAGSFPKGMLAMAYRPDANWGTGSGGGATAARTQDAVLNAHAVLTTPNAVDTTSGKVAFVTTATGGRFYTPASFSATTKITTVLTMDGTPTQGTLEVSDFGAPSASQRYLARRARWGVSDSSTMTANGFKLLDNLVAYLAVTPNVAPVTSAGADQTVLAGSTVTLHATATDSDGPSPVTYAWAQTAGPALVLSSASAREPTFTAPSSPTSLTFRVTASDGDLTSTDDVVIIVQVEVTKTLIGGEWVDCRELTYHAGAFA